jgi:hypothetical protein
MSKNTKPVTYKVKGYYECLCCPCCGHEEDCCRDEEVFLTEGHATEAEAKSAAKAFHSTRRRGADVVTYDLVRVGPLGGERLVSSVRYNVENW